eukprot:TRINITY_DN70746_c0_g1_i1.p1 TRINITY_DN70746_c0_g1~~TRINITY_DN70746_c0_g1_i1.p1  ORF type:complete len:660 (+),score=249.76 TRINITY_DN70746_c0_g1_i1:91-1980(+)
MLCCLCDALMERPLAAALTALCILVAVLWQKFFAIDGKVPAADCKEHGGNMVAKVLKEHGVKFIYTLSGGHISSILVGAKQQGLRVVDVRHEVNAVFAADATARLTGIPGVAVVTAGPGVTNTVTAVKNCQLAQSPIVVIGGAAATLLKGRGALQDVDQMSLFRSICKWSATVSRVRDVAPTMRTALQKAQEGTPGPVFVELPIDTLYPIELVQREVGGFGKGKGLLASIVRWYLNRHICRLFAGAFECKTFGPLPVRVPRHSSSELQAAAGAISRAKRPVFVVGSQACVGGPEAAKALQKALMSIGVPTFLSGMARGLLGREAPIWLRQRRGEALREADVIVLLGVPADFRLSYGAALSKRAAVITVNRCPTDLSKNAPFFWKPKMKVLADPSNFAVALAAAGCKCQVGEWLQLLRGRQEEKEAANAKRATEKFGDNVNPLHLASELDKQIGENTILIGDGGDFVATCSYIVRPPGPLSWLDPGVFGTLGVGGGFALAAKLCRPEADVWILYGDGSSAYSLAEFDTFNRHGLPVVALIGNDACWSQIEREQVEIFKDDVACPLAFSDYHVVAKGYGGDGAVLKGPGLAEADVTRAISTAKSSVLEKRVPWCLNAHIDKSDFRKGSISV